MHTAIVLGLGIVLLYLLYRLVGAILFPLLSKRQLERYKDQFFEQNPHIDRARYESLQKEQEDRTLIIEKRKLFKF